MDFTAYQVVLIDKQRLILCKLQFVSRNFLVDFLYYATVLAKNAYSFAKL